MKLFKSNFLSMVGLVAAILSIFFLSCSNSNSDSDERAATETSLQTSDWLFLFYFDADNDLNDSIWQNLNESEKALAVLKDQNAKDNSAPSVKCVVLWDGVNNKDKDGKIIEKYKNLTRIHPESALLELGESDGTDSKSKKDWFISSKTKDLTNTEDVKSWLPEEASMNNASTLTNFLIWAKKHYTATNIVLTLSDHGSGTDYEKISGGALRSLCNDESSTAGSLTTTDLKYAIDMSGFKPHVLWMDCCSQASLEIAYDLRGYAKSLVSSASISIANDYETVLEFLPLNETYENFSSYVVSAYRHFYYSKADTAIRATFGQDENFSSSYKSLTQVGIDLDTKKQEDLYKAIDNLAQSLLTYDDEKLTAIYNNYLYQNPKNAEECKGWVYAATFAYLADIGYFCYQLAADSTLAKVGVSNETVDAAVKVGEALNAVIQSSWVGKREKDEDALFRLNVFWTKEEADKKGKASSEVLEPVQFEIDPDSKDPKRNTWEFGPTITIDSIGDKAEDGGFLDAGYSIVTGYSSQWAALLKKWHYN